MGAAFSLFTLNACTEMVLFNDQVETEDSKLSNIPLDFTWSMSKDVNIEIKSDVTTRVFIYEDEDFSKLMCTKVLEADVPETISLTALESVEKLYLAYIDRNDKTALRAIGLVLPISQAKSMTQLRCCHHLKATRPWYSLPTVQSSELYCLRICIRKWATMT